MTSGPALSSLGSYMCSEIRMVEACVTSNLVGGSGKVKADVGNMLLKVKRLFLPRHARPWGCIPAAFVQPCNE